MFPPITLGVKSTILLLVLWTVISNFTDFYEVFRFTAPSAILLKSTKQFSVFSLVLVSLLFLLKREVEPKLVLRFIIYLIIIISFFKFGIYYLLRKYRQILGGNFRRVIIIGQSQKTEELSVFFDQNKDLGYRLHTVLSQKSEINDFKRIVGENYIDEIYCDLNSVSKEFSDEVIAYAHSNFKTIKLIPDNSALSHNMFFDYYGYIPLISIRKTPLELWFNYWVKRIFDVIFSLLAIVFVLSWLIPIIAFLIKTDSKGPIFFKQKRHGINNQEFDCFKFRSMKVNSNADIELASKDDIRITKFGKFLRKSSIDEMPQFLNVLLGDMSVVGPRPHMLSVNKEYAQRFDKFMERHYIRPGVTGLAQVNGFRGEVITDKDVENRLKFDLYYIENWSLFLDIKIILITVKNFIIGDEKAY